MKKIAIAFLMFCLFSVGEAQDLNFLNTNQSLVNVNPSFAGSNGLVRNQLSYRNQWPGLSGTYQQMNNTLDFFLKPIKAGVALSVQAENASRLTRGSGFGLAYAQHISFSDSKNKLIPSVELYYRKRTLDLTYFHFGTAPSFTWNGVAPVISNKEYLDVNAGLLYSHLDRLFIGGAVAHLNSPDAGVLGEVKLRQKYTVHGSFNFFLGDRSVLQLAYKWVKQGNYMGSQVSSSMVFAEHFVAGAGYAQGDLVFVNAGYRANMFMVSLGYDVTVSKLSGNTAGSWEMHASFNLREKENRKKLTSFEKM